MDQSTEKVVEAIKASLRAKGWTYQQLASRMGLSESGLKKAMTSGDLSLSRLFRICEICELNAAELLSMADQSAIAAVELSREQEEYLMKNPKALRLYWRLKVDGMSRAEFQKRYQVPREETTQILSKLERVNLLKVTARGQIEFTHPGPIRWKAESPLVKYLNGIWSRQLIDRAIDSASSKDFINIAGLRLSETQVAELRQEILELFEKYSRTSGRPAPGHPSTPLALLIAFTPFHFDL